MLTRKQHELLMFIHERIKETGVSPSFDEMKEALDLASSDGGGEMRSRRGVLNSWCGDAAAALSILTMCITASARSSRGISCCHQDRSDLPGTGPFIASQ